IRSTRGSSPKIASDRVALPASFPSRATTLSSITRPPSSQQQRPFRQLEPPYRRPWRLALRPLPLHRQHWRPAPPPALQAWLQTFESAGRFFLQPPRSLWTCRASELPWAVFSSRRRARSPNRFWHRALRP